MSKKEFCEKLDSYRKTDLEYAGILSYILMYCQDDFFPLFKQAESSGRKLKLGDREEKLWAKHPDICFEPYVELGDIYIV